MGIPHLTSHIHPYLLSTVLGCSTSDCKRHSNLEAGPTKLIIDGPGLAYYLYYRLLAHKPYHLRGLDAIPSYDELGKAALRFLDGLQEHRVIMYGTNITKSRPPAKLPLQRKDLF